VIPRRLVAALAVLSGAAFLLLGGLVASRWEPLVSDDLAVEHRVHSWALGHPAAVDTAQVITTLGSPVAVDVVAALVVAALLLGGLLRPALVVVLARVVELGVETGVKFFVGRPRPVLEHPLATATSFSFPSGHAAGSAAVYGVLALLLLRAAATAAPDRALPRRVVPVAVAAILAFAVAVAASRVVLGVHFPSDVVAGLVLGFGCAFAGVAALPVEK
jgi:undecaprenyl-diphosphatase